MVPLLYYMSLIFRCEERVIEFILNCWKSIIYWLIYLKAENAGKKWGRSCPLCHVLLSVFFFRHMFLFCITSFLSCPYFCYFICLHDSWVLVWKKKLDYFSYLNTRQQLLHLFLVKCSRLECLGCRHLHLTNRWLPSQLPLVKPVLLQLHNQKLIQIKYQGPFQIHQSSCLTLVKATRPICPRYFLDIHSVNDVLLSIFPFFDFLS